MTTVGYGDYFQKTYVGRSVAGVAIIIGQFLTGLVITALSNITRFERPERRVSFF